MSTLDDQLAALLSEPNSALLKQLKALLKPTEPSKDRLSTVRSSASRLHAPYLNRTTVVCSLCNSSRTTTLGMAWSVEQGGYISSYSLLRDDGAEVLRVHNVTLITESCEQCPSILINQTKESLIALLMDRTKRDALYNETRNEVLRENKNKEVF